MVWCDCGEHQALGQNVSLLHGHSLDLGGEPVRATEVFAGEKIYSIFYSFE